jgi:uncharacterized protein YicC (UPF0701 family)
MEVGTTQTERAWIEMENNDDIPVMGEHEVNEELDRLRDGVDQLGKFLECGEGEDPIEVAICTIRDLRITAADRKPFPCECDRMRAIINQLFRSLEPVEILLALEEDRELVKVSAPKKRSTVERQQDPVPIAELQQRIVRQTKKFMEQIHRPEKQSGEELQKSIQNVLDELKKNGVGG